MATNHNILQTAVESSGDKSSTAVRPVTKRAAFNRYAIGESIAVLFCPSSNHKIFAVTIDAEDLSRVVAAGPWSVSNFDARGGVKLYCHSTRRINGKMAYLHRFLMDAPADRAIEVDHIHNRSLDNRKGEMRLASKSLNQRNKGRSGPVNRFGHRGVIATRSGTFSARVWINHKSKILGTFATPELAGERVRQYLIENGASYAAGATA